MGEEMTEFKKPTIISCQEVPDPRQLENYGIPVSSSHVDLTVGALKELYEIKFPARKDAFKENEFEQFLTDMEIDLNTYGNWVYYPWRGTLLKVPPAQDLRLIRTARNQLLITQEEQKELFGKTILIAGMSVGSNVVDQLIHIGVGGTLILADMDRLEISNLNRIQTGLLDVNLPKVVSVAQKALELDPYLDIILLDQGVSDEILGTLTQDMHLIIDEVDDIAAKIAMRRFARENRIALIMATDNSDGAILDVERFDVNADQEFFHGKIPPAILEKMTSGELSREESGKYIGQYFVGLDVVDNRLLGSLLEVKKSIPSWPQLGSAAALSGILSAYAARMILLGETLTQERLVLDFDKRLNAKFSSDEYHQDRVRIMQVMSSQPQ